jgi:hypothetical protein
MRDGQMHQTTMRFGPDLWFALEEECRRQGVSAAQYIREAVLARLIYTAGRRGDDELEEALTLAGALSTPLAGAAAPTSAARAKAPLRRDEGATHTASEVAMDSSALAGQSVVALERARALRERSESLRGRGRRLRK